MLGTSAKPKLKLKAAEAKTTMYAVLDILRGRAAKVDAADILIEAGALLCKYQDTMDAHGQHLPGPVIQDR
jgi:hypothetical protein